MRTRLKKDKKTSAFSGGGIAFKAKEWDDLTS